MHQSPLPNYKRAFQDADIRGVYPSELNEEVTYLTARAFVSEFNYTDVLVGYDMRLSSASLEEAFVQGVVDAGANAIVIGLVHSPMLYFASGTLKLPGVMITASHSPAEYNGLKLVEPGAVPLTMATGLRRIRERITAGIFIEPARKGKRKAKSVRAAYQKFVVGQVKPKQLANLCVAADVGNGMGSVMLATVSEKLPTAFTTLFPELDGRFPNRGSDPTLKKNQRHIAAELKAGSYDFGVAFDGDADRVAFFDETGRFINCAEMGALIAERLLARHPGSPVVYTNLTSKVLVERIAAAGGVPVRARVGHAFIKRKMAEVKAVFGCEHSGHFYFQDYFYTDSSALTLLLVLEAYAEAKARGVRFSEFVAPYHQYQQLEDEVIDVFDKPFAMRLTEHFIRDTFPTMRIKKFDGLYIDNGRVWGGVKPSVTEHALKVMLEGVAKRDAAAVQERIVAFIKTIANARPK